MSKKIFILVFIFVLIFIPYSFYPNGVKNINAETIINYQIITEDTTWTLASSPFLIINRKSMWRKPMEVYLVFSCRYF